MKTLVVSLLLMAFAQNTLAAEMFCGFFADRTPITIEYKTKDSAIITMDGLKSTVKISSRYEHGLTHNEGCDEASICATDIEVNYSGLNTDIRVTDFLSYAEITGIINGVKIPRGVGSCQ